MSTRSLLDRLEANQPVIARRDAAYRGALPLRFLNGRVDPKIMRFSTNLAPVAVNAVAERVRLEDVSVTVGGRDESERARRLIEDSDLPMTLQAVIVDMLAVGSAYLLVWVDDFGRPVVTGESAEQVAVERDPVTRAVVAAVKRWYVRDVNGVTIEEHVVKYGRHEIVHLVRDPLKHTLTFVDKVPNPLGAVPVVPLVNTARLGDEQGTSVVDDLAPLLDALNKIFADMLVTSESVARPKRFATGVMLEDEDEGGFIADEVAPAPGAAGGPEDDSVRSPFRDSDDMWISEQSEARFGQLAGADLTPYRTAVDLIMQQIMAVTSLPPHLVGITTSNPATAEALRASEVALASRAASRVRVINKPMEWAVRMLVAVDMGVDPAAVDCSLRWADTSTRSVAQEADAAVKLHAEGVTTTDEARAAVGVGSDRN